MFTTDLAGHTFFAPNSTAQKRNPCSSRREISPASLTQKSTTKGN